MDLSRPNMHYLEYNERETLSCEIIPFAKLHITLLHYHKKQHITWFFVAFDCVIKLPVVVILITTFAASL